MNIKNLTWLGFFLTLSSCVIAQKTLAIDYNKIDNSGKQLNNIEARLNRISEVLKIGEKDLPENVENYPNSEILLGGFINGNRGWRNGGWRNGGGFFNNRGGGGFLNDRGGGAFLNNRGWGDGGFGFLNRRW
ncbi:hypothetical protein [Geminocystis sp. NIES-3709]|uniref:hypothetical protein n=1 Tax=Geminocystis sp. NIES-3709 TaxID=1617448 RepID=UPI0005FC3ADD|nr:hypothetical protein [Geminocystis sp. NIES-3709]BAQ66837.1 hypothetical protein GM3709_3602 [Geminocystis sp. NIES-3709]